MTALTWNSGSAAKITESSSSRVIAAIIQALATSLAWVCAASFGSPVVPPVWKIVAMSVPRGSSPANSSGAHSAASSSSDPSPMTVSTAPDSSSAAAVAAQPGSASEAMTTRAPRRSTSPPMCSAASPGLIGAAIPASWAARVAVISASQLGLSRTTGSLRRTPLECNRFAARTTSVRSRP